jgi:hypothetical protein
MKKSLIAMAVAAALPVAAQADATLSGSVTTTYNNQRAIASDAASTTSVGTGDLIVGTNAYSSYLKGADAVEVEASLKMSISEELDNGMTAAAAFTVEDNSGVSASLAGDFGSLSIGSAGTEDTMDAGDIAGIYDATTATGNAITYTGTMGDMTVGLAQQSGANGNSQVYASMGFQGITFGVGSASPRGVSSSSKNVVGASYTIEGFTLKAGKASNADSVASASYTNTLGDLAFTAEVSSDDTSTVSATYTMGDLAVTAKSVRTAASAYEIDTNATGYNSSAANKTNAALHGGSFVGGTKAAATDNTVSATYTMGDLAITASSDNTMSFGMDMGNADLTFSRVAAADATNTGQTGLVSTDQGYKVAVPAHTKLTYKVSF